MLFIIATALVLNCIVSAALLIHFYHQAPSDKHAFLRYGIAYYACLILVYAAYMSRLSLPFLGSVFFTNFFSLLANCALLFAIQSQLEKRLRPWRSLWTLYPFFAATVAVALAHYYPEKHILRSLNLYIHNAVVYLAVLYTLSGHFYHRPSPHSKALSASVVSLILLSFIMPLVFVTTSKMLTQHISLASIQLVTAQISLAIILILLFNSGAPVSKQPDHR